MTILTLTTDFGYKDHFVGALKGAIFSELENATIVDVSHSINPFNIQECAYILKNSYKTFPKGTIHIVGVDAELTKENEHIITYVDGHYFISANNGVVCLITSEIKPDNIVSINIPDTKDGPFPTYDVFVKAACHLVRGGKMEVVGKPFKDLNTFKDFVPQLVDGGNTIIGNIVYIDNYGNVVSNIQKNLFDAYRNGRDYEVRVRGKVLKQIFNKYSDIINYEIDENYRKGPGDLLALFNSSLFLELAIYKSNLTTVGGASTLLGLDYRDTVTINFL
ncbi:SAM-dependent chlorinase/fluorinase [Cellulophaga sp. 20_2_10]|uniref:SAM hydrolase/SAM-dependent halogenase family protein n=1 Tax=Cellulophaga sp. 20_2_10 TaxID=2942476 RepID=UPI00201B0596|nr:SAM-dependent chlorinase/fluorinase [Cellulophaga sp. 20_2_10]MCL5246262.1 SAM-dependent chlorinase/fluorinase [Cellulophaga sp. 20_2_10]